MEEKHCATVAKPALHWADFILPIVLFVLHGMLYNPIGNVAASRGVDFGQLLNTPLDALIPLCVVFIVPYTALWLLPIAMLVMLARRQSVNAGDMRCISAGFAALMGICYVLWITFPMQVSLRADEATLKNLGALGSFTWFTYQNASSWNCCPSFHVAAPWLVCRIMAMYCGRAPLWAMGLAVAVIIATVAIRIHYLLDIVGGILVSEAVYRFVLKPVQKRRAFDGVPRTTVVWMSIAIALIGFTVIQFLVRWFPD